MLNWSPCGSLLSSHPESGPEEKIEEVSSVCAWQWRRKLFVAGTGLTSCAKSYDHLLSQSPRENKVQAHIFMYICERKIYLNNYIHKFGYIHIIHIQIFTIDIIHEETHKKDHAFKISFFLSLLN